MWQRDIVSVYFIQIIVIFTFLQFFKEIVPQQGKHIKVHP